MTAPNPYKQLDLPFVREDYAAWEATLEEYMLHYVVSEHFHATGQESGKYFFEASDALADQTLRSISRTHPLWNRTSGELEAHDREEAVLMLRDLEARYASIAEDMHR